MKLDNINILNTKLLILKSKKLRYVARSMIFVPKFHYPLMGWEQPGDGNLDAKVVAFVEQGSIVPSIKKGGNVAVMLKIHSFHSAGSLIMIPICRTDRRNRQSSTKLYCYKDHCSCRLDKVLSNHYTTSRRE